MAGSLVTLACSNSSTPYGTLGGDVDGLAGGQVPDKLASLFGIDHGVFVRVIDRLVG